MTQQGPNREQAIRMPFTGTGWVARAAFELVGHGNQAKDLAEEIAIGQSLGSWSTTHATFEELSFRVARLVSEERCPDSDTYRFTVEFPEHLWHKNLSWLVKLVFGKMSFVEGVRWTGLDLDARGPDLSTDHPFGPRHSTDAIRTLTGCPNGRPLLMGILKPAVALSDAAIAALIVEAGSAGLNLIKDDEIRHDQSLDQVLRRVETVSQALDKAGLRTLYVVHYQNFTGAPQEEARLLTNAGARAFLVCPWTDGWHAVQALRKQTDAVIATHPALAGAFGTLRRASIAPAVSLGMLPRLAGADLSLFPSPYGRIGLPQEDAHTLAQALKAPLPTGSAHQRQSSQHTCGNQSAESAKDATAILQTTPVPSAGIQPQHVAPAYRDFGPDHILNAGTAIFSGASGPTQAVKAFLKEMEEL